MFLAFSESRHHFIGRATSQPLPHVKIIALPLSHWAKTISSRPPRIIFVLYWYRALVRKRHRKGIDSSQSYTKSRILRDIAFSPSARDSTSRAVRVRRNCFSAAHVHSYDWSWLSFQANRSLNQWGCQKDIVPSPDTCMPASRNEMTFPPVVVTESKLFYFSFHETCSIASAQYPSAILLNQKPTCFENKTSSFFSLLSKSAQPRKIKPRASCGTKKRLPIAARSTTWWMRMPTGKEGFFLFFFVARRNWCPHDISFSLYTLFFLFPS